MMRSNQAARRAARRNQRAVALRAQSAVDRALRRCIGLRDAVRESSGGEVGDGGSPRAQAGDRAIA